MTTTLVSSANGLLSALASASPGETILLAPGSYGSVSLQNLSFSSNVTIASQYATNPAVLTGLTMSSDSGLTLSNIQVDGVGANVWQYATVTDSSNLTFEGMLFQGSGTVPSNNAGGMNLNHSTNVTIENSMFDELSNGLSESFNTNVTISGSTFTNIENHEIENAGTSYLSIVGNTFTNIEPLPTDHPDAIIFWTENTTTSATNIVIANNTITRGGGAAAQGIFVQDDSGVLPYLNVQINNNTVIGEGYNGIYVQGSVGAQISNNVVQPYADEDSRIRVMDSTNPSLSNNEAGSYVIVGENDTGLTQTNDTVLAPIPVPTLVSGTGTVSVTSSTTIAAAQPPAAPTGLLLDPSTASGVAGSNITKDAQVVIDGSAAAGSTVTLYDGTTVIGTGVANASTGAFSIEANAALANGTHTLTAIATLSGQASAASSALSVMVDTQAATASITHASGSPGFGSSVTLTGTASDAVSGVGYTVSIFQDGTQIGTVTPTNGAWTFTEKSVPNAVQTYTVSTTDAAGNTGAGANDVIVGTNGADHIVGGPGNNLIVGGLGADTLTGGPGTNTFIYNTVNDAPAGRNPETITNWVSGSDHLDLTALGHLTFGGETQNGTAGSVDWYVSGGNTYVEAVVQGHKPDLMIELLGVHNLSASDFVLH